jgi:hypothetical protein
MNRGLEPQKLKKYLDKKYQQGIDDNISRDDHQMARIQGWMEATDYFIANFRLINKEI